MTPSEQLYEKGKSLLGVNLAPGNERLGCAISLSAVYNKAFPDNPPLRFVNTTQWYEFMLAGWTKLDKPEPNCVIVSVTSQIPPDSPLSNGHIGIVGHNLAPDDSFYIMSNNSFLGYWDTKFTLNKWLNFYVNYGKIPTYFFMKNNT
jgi:hypothetical protein